jgi:hypothetical protein
MDETPNPVQVANSGPNCTECHNPMQLAEEVKHGDKVIATRYVCYCSGVLKHVNFHSGQKTERGD